MNLGSVFPRLCASWVTSYRYLGYLEAHIEQGPQLERHSQTIGVVSSIVGMRQLRIACAGRQNHAGATAMADRRDAAMEAMRLATALDDALRALCAGWEEGGCAAVWTFSKLSGFISHSTVPGAANLTLQFRAPQEEMVEAMERLVHATTASAAATAGTRGAAVCSVGLDRASVTATPMDDGLQARRAGVTCRPHASAPRP